jgi:hypothetical protein
VSADDLREVASRGLDVVIVVVETFLGEDFGLLFGEQSE